MDNECAMGSGLRYLKHSQEIRFGGLAPSVADIRGAADVSTEAWPGTCDLVFDFNFLLTSSYIHIEHVPPSQSSSYCYTLDVDPSLTVAGRCLPTALVR